ncbi:hypothetical protein ACFQ08_25250, partial [Streptosporangium algeriense]
TPTYTCDQVLPGVVVLGHGNCAASNGAVEQGEFQGESLVTAREEPRWTFRCRFGGRAQLPNEVIPSPASTASIRSRSARSSTVSRCPTGCEVRSAAPLRAVPTILARMGAPGRITLAAIRYRAPG